MIDGKKYEVARYSMAWYGIVQCAFDAPSNIGITPYHRLPYHTCARRLAASTPPAALDDTTR